jgi:hypothetical protein
MGLLPAAHKIRRPAKAFAPPAYPAYPIEAPQATDNPVANPSEFQQTQDSTHQQVMAIGAQMAWANSKQHPKIAPWP